MFEFVILFLSLCLLFKSCSGYKLNYNSLKYLNVKQNYNNQVRAIKNVCLFSSNNYRENKKGGRKPNDNIKQMKVARLLRDELSDIICNCDIKV